MAKQKSKVTIPTYFEVSVDRSIRRYTTTEYLPSKKEVLEFCRANGIPVKSEQQVVTIILRSQKTNIVLVSAK